MTKKEFTTVEEMAKATISNAEFKKIIARRLEERSVVNHLVALRGARGLSQQDIATRLNCSQSRISKLEKTRDADVRLGDVIQYLGAVGHSLHLGIADSRQPLVAVVKYHVFSIRQAVRRLVKLAHLDKDIARGVAGFFGEACFNFIRIMQESAKEMPVSANGETLLRIDVIGHEYQPEPENDVESDSVCTTQNSRCGQPALTA